jgi:hypothetical protein
MIVNKTCFVKKPQHLTLISHSENVSNALGLAVKPTLDALSNTNQTSSSRTTFIH